MKTCGAFFLFFTCSLLFSQAAFSQGFSSIEDDLNQLESLIEDTLSNTIEQQTLLEDLRTSLAESGNLIGHYEIRMNEQEHLLKDLQARLNEMSEIYRTQSALSARYERRSKFWKTFTLVGIPVTAAVSGVVVWALVK